MVSRVDQIYRSILLTKFFVRGWGKPENLRRIFAFRKILSNRETCQHLVDKTHPVSITKEVDNGDHTVLEAEFISPFVEQLPGLLPKESEKAKFQIVLPKVWRTPHLKPTCLHLAGTGDHGFWRRKMLMAKPLLDDYGIASVILENPFYGCRKPKDQLRSSLHNVSDLFVMGGCLVLESLVIFHWCERQGLGPLGITGISMGGHGVLSGAINWEMLKNQYFSSEVFREELFNMIQSPEGHFPVYHEVGQHFAREFPKSLSHVQQLMEDHKENTPRREYRQPREQEQESVAPQRVASGGGGLSLSLPKLNIFNALGLSGSSRQQQKENVLVGYRKAKSQVFRPDFTPVGIRPKQAVNMPEVKFEPYMPVKDALTWEAVQFMRGVMDECTHLANFSIPVDPTLVIIVAAKNDGYMPRSGIIPLTDLWPGSEMRTLKTGHVAAYLFNHQMFRKAIRDSFDRVIDKYYS
ncbi:hypothetical protein O3P69_005023 [Scylla paramamosain]|uniref:Protein ABHD18 n=1 Tax=Scylla paramamosain TaxID=85552 RepID=A0AAW0U9N0_SCYPA